MVKVKSRLVPMICAAVLAIVCWSLLEDTDSSKMIQADATDVTIASIQSHDIEASLNGIFDFIAANDAHVEKRFSTIPKRSYISAVLQEEIVFDSKMVMGTRIVYDSGEDIKQVDFKASQVYVSGNRNAVLENCTVHAFAELNLLKVLITARKMQCMSLQGEMIEFPVNLVAVGDDLAPGTGLTTCNKVSVQTDSGQIVPQCVTGTIAAGTVLSFLVVDDVITDTSIGYFTDDIEQSGDQNRDTFHGSAIEDHSLKFTVELLQFGKVAFIRDLRSIDSLPVSIAVWGSNGYRHAVKIPDDSTGASDDESIWRLRASPKPMAAGALYRDGFRLSIRPIGQSAKTIKLEVEVESHVLDHIQAFEHKKVKELYEIPTVLSETKTVVEELQWGHSLAITVPNLGAIHVTPNRGPAPKK